jgi:predicted nuclease of restriction endonuclease-like (RecB) superfamily
VKHRYRSAQVKAAVKVNAEKLLFNWQLGRDLVQKKAEERWGSGVVEQVSLDLRREFPNEFGFATVEHEIYDEDEMEAALTRNVTDLLLEMGTGFAFIGKQKEIIVGGRSRKIDLLFYHIRLRCFIACELKAKPFEPEFAGKLNFYVNAVDELVRTPDDNPTIGLLICSDMNKTEVQWSFKGITTPIGVATYNNIRIKDVLPTKEQLKERMELLQKEMRKTKLLMSKNK